MRKFYLVAAAAVMMVGCAKEQSEFNSKDLQNKALPQGTVVGTVKYDAGAYKDANGVIFQEHFIPAAGQQVKIEVGNDSYVSNAKGDQTFVADIDQEGKFSYSLPLGLAATNVKVSVIPFYAEKKVVVAGALVSIPNALYNVGVGPTSKQLNNKDVKTYDFNVTSDATIEEQLSQKVTVTGRVLLQQWIKDPDDPSTFKIDNKAIEKRWNLTCKVTTFDKTGAVDQEYTKTAIQTNTEGAYSFVINLPDNWKDMTFKPTLTITTKAELDNEFSAKYYDNDKAEWKSQTCQVLYPSEDANYNITASNEIVPAKINEIIIQPELQEKGGVKGIGNLAIDKDGSKTLYSLGKLNTQWAY